MHVVLHSSMEGGRGGSRLCQGPSLRPPRSERALPSPRWMLDVGCVPVPVAPAGSRASCVVRSVNQRTCDTPFWFQAETRIIGSWPEARLSIF